MQIGRIAHARIDVNPRADMNVGTADTEVAHLRLNRRGAALQAIAFRAVGTPLGDGLLGARGQTIHAVGRLKRNEWNGQVTVQLEIEDAAPAGA